MTLSIIAIFCILALLYQLLPANTRGWVLLILSAIGVYFLQPDLTIRWLDFLLPTLTILITITTWLITREKQQGITRQDWLSGGIVLALIIGLSLLRFVPAEWRVLVAGRPPSPILVALVLAIGVAVIAGLNRLRWSLTVLLIVLIGVFVLLKTELFAVWIAQGLRAWEGRDPTLATALDLNWLGFSYVAFRLIHTVRDRQQGLLPAITLREYVTYVIFFPSFIAGPIDRAERFIKDFRALPEMQGFDGERFTVGLTRILIGIGKKFVIADTLALGMALNNSNATQADSTLMLWLLLYGYALRLFFDFSGYSDIAIGIGILFGIRLPENFKQPYTRTSITTFWQSWHVTLSDWARFYVFSPLSRNLIRRKPKPSPILIVLVAQLATMIVIGLWHGVTWSFLVWGIWHGIGLWLHKQFSDRTRKFYRELKNKPAQQRLADSLSWFVTFHFVVLGWVWFALPIDSAVATFGRLFGVL